MDGRGSSKSYKCPERTVDKVIYEDPWKPNLRIKMTITTLIILTLLAALDGTSTSAALTTINVHLHGTIVEASWLGSAFLLSSTISMPILGRLSDIWGRQPIAIMTVIFFTVGSILGGVAHSYKTLLVGRAIQGLGGGGCLASAEIIMADLIPLNVRGNYNSFLGAAWAVGSVAGPLVGGALATSRQWRWIFFLNLPVCGASLVAILVFMKFEKLKSTVHQKLSELDYIGTVLFTLSLACLLLAITLGGEFFPWNSWHIITPFILGSIGAIAFVAYEVRCAESPLITLTVFYNRCAAVGYFQSFLHGLVLWGLIYFLPLYYQGVKGYNPLMSGVAMLPESLLIAPSAVFTGLTVSKLSRYMFISWSSWALMTLGIVCLTSLDLDTTIGQYVGLNILVSIGAGMMYSVSNFVTMAPLANNKDSGQAALMLGFCRTMGQAFGIAICGSIFSNNFAKQIDIVPSLRSWSQTDAFAIIEVLHHMPESQLKTELITAFNQALRFLFHLLLIFVGLGLVLNALGQDHPLESTAAQVQRLRSAKEDDIDKSSQDSVLKNV